MQPDSKPLLWGAAGLLLGVAAGVGLYHVIGQVYRGQVADYGSAIYTVGNYESTFLYWFGGLGLLALIGLTVAFLLLLPEKLNIPDWSIACIPLAVTLALAARFLVFGQSAISDEENVHRFTAQLLAHGRLTLHSELPADLFGQRWGWMARGQDWSGIYPYGWPALLAIGYLLRIPWLINPLLAGVAVWLAGEVGRRAFSDRAGSLAMLLLSLAPFFALTAATDSSTVLGATAVLAAIWSALRYNDDARNTWLFSCGASSAVAILARPAAAAALLLPWIAWIVWRHKGAKCLAPVAAAIVLLLALNAHLTGSAFETAYHAALRDSGVNLDGATLGFGADYRAVGGFGVHTLTLGILNDAGSLFRLNVWLLGCPLGLLLVCCAPWQRATKLFAASLTAFLIVATTWFSPGIAVTGPSEYFEVACLLVILAAAGLDRLGVPALGTAIVAVNLALFTPLQVRALHTMSRGSSLLARTVQEHVPGPAVVFVETLQPERPTDEALKSYVFVPPMPASMDDRVIFLPAGDAQQDREAWHQYFPNRAAFHYRLSADWKPALEPLP